MEPKDLHTEKECVDCEVPKPIKNFSIIRIYVSKKGKGITLHRNSVCNVCQSKRSKKSVLRNAESIKKKKDYQKEYNPEYQREYRRKNLKKRDTKLTRLDKIMLQFKNNKPPQESKINQ